MGNCGAGEAGTTADGKEGVTVTAGEGVATADGKGDTLTGVGGAVDVAEVMVGKGDMLTGVAGAVDDALVADDVVAAEMAGATVRIPCCVAKIAW